MPAGSSFARNGLSPHRDTLLGAGGPELPQTGVDQVGAAVGGAVAVAGDRVTLAVVFSCSSLVNFIGTVVAVADLNAAC